MSKMHKLNNEGSATLEITMVMPIIIFLIIFCIFLFIDVINDSIIQGETYSTIYSLSADDFNNAIEDKYNIDEQITNQINDKIVGVNNEPDVDTAYKKGEVYTTVNATLRIGGDIYRYQGEKRTYKKEVDLCTDRLRRWQLYGDILWE